jgi:hypothetical protein
LVGGQVAGVYRTKLMEQFSEVVALIGFIKPELIE